MSIYRIKRCKSCNYKKRDQKPTNQKVCPTCGGSLYYSKNYYFTYRLDGKKYEKAAGPDRKLAQEAEWRKKIDIKDGKAYAPISWKDAVEDLERTYRNLSPKTVEMYLNSVRKLSQVFGTMSLPNLTERHLIIYKDEHLKKGLSSSSFNRDRATLKRMFALSGVEWRFRKSIFTSEPEKHRDRILNEEEKSKLINACKKNKLLYTAIFIGLDTGLRKTSLFTLQWKNINFKDNLIIKEGKGGKVHRIPMTTRLRNYLIKYRANQKVLSIWVLPSPKNISRPITDIRKSFASACKEAGIKDLRFHDLRRSFGSFVVMSTKDITLAQELLGHADITTTRKHYGHLLDEHIKNGIDVFEEATI